MTKSDALDARNTAGLGCCDIAGADAVALNIILAELGTDVAGEHLQTTLGCRIGGNGLASQLTHHRTNVDDLAMSYPLHSRDDSFGDDEGSVQVSIDHLAEFLHTHLFHRDTAYDTGIVYQDVDGADLAFYGGYQFLYGALIAHIAYVSFDVIVAIGPVLGQTSFQ